VSDTAAGGRRCELAARLAEVQDRIASACADAGRDPAGVRLVVVTKFFPVGDLELLAGLGVADVGESRDQEASAKLAALGPEPRRALHVHFIGQVQSRKAGSVARYADTVHSIDRTKLVAALDRGAEAAGRRLQALVQVNLEDDPQGAARGGVRPAQARELADAVAATTHLDLRGVMAVAPLGADPARAFAELQEVAAAVRADHPEAGWISAGMSADLEAAVANGATHLRVGTAILGSRPPLR
jgi:pyridoxal phosphate enzyme (YggS family)